MPRGTLSPVRVLEKGDPACPHLPEENKDSCRGRDSSGLVRVTHVSAGTSPGVRKGLHVSFGISKRSPTVQTAEDSAAPFLCSPPC